MADPVSWYAIESGWRVVTDDGEAIGQILEVLGDDQLDIFNGLVVNPGIGRTSRYVDATLVETIEQGEISLGLGSDEVELLPQWTG